mmetsp:Transcript_1892/g.3087  ORF Transcript_1892/g.3087 Transcript_1892/m.3087 type:complete len:285 (+) Transcript_1892:185-1039(+)
MSKKKSMCFLQLLFQQFSRVHFFLLLFHNNLANRAPALSNKTPSLPIRSKNTHFQNRKETIEYNLELGDVDAGGGGGVEDAGPLGVGGFAVRFELARFLCVLAAALFVQLDVHLHVHFEDALGESLHGLVPVTRGTLGERAEDIRQENTGLALRQHVHTQVLRVPVVQCTLSHLEVRRAQACSQQAEEVVLHLHQLFAPAQLQHLLELVEEEYLLGCAGPRPEAHQPVHDDHNRLGVLFNILRDAVRQLGVVDGHAAGLVQGDEGLLQKLNVLFLQRDREAVDN